MLLEKIKEKTRNVFLNYRWGIRIKRPGRIDLMFLISFKRARASVVVLNFFAMSHRL